MSEFDGAVAIVTGGASGLGAATAALLAERGARVAVLDRDLTGVPAQFFTALCDVTEPRRWMRQSPRLRITSAASTS